MNAAEQAREHLRAANAAMHQALRGEAMKRNPPVALIRMPHWVWQFVCIGSLTLRKPGGQLSYDGIPVEIDDAVDLYEVKLEAEDRAP